jgi:hypothetical protein
VSIADKLSPRLRHESRGDLNDEGARYMILETNDDLGHAKRLNQKVVAYYRDNQEFAGRGIIIAFNADAITLLDGSSGVYNFLRENVYIIDEDQILN